MLITKGLNTIEGITINVDTITYAEDMTILKGNIILDLDLDTLATIIESRSITLDDWVHWENPYKIAKYILYSDKPKSELAFYGIFSADEIASMQGMEIPASIYLEDNKYYGFTFACNEESE